MGNSVVNEFLEFGKQNYGITLVVVESGDKLTFADLFPELEELLDEAE